MLKDNLNNQWIGSVSHGTLRNIDLLESYINLSKCIRNKVNLKPYYKERLTRLAFESKQLINNLTERELENSEEAIYLINEDWFYLYNEIAPENCYFGTSEGDGSDIGFWPDWDNLTEEEILNIIE